jgi:very-short-patch-repair endonuclease
MSDYVLIGVAVLVVALLGLLVLLKGAGAAEALPVVARRLMTEREREVMILIEEAVPHCRVHSQVAMAALIDARKGLSRKDYVSVRNKFDRKIVDFVLENKASGDVLALIELDDRSHNAAKDRRRDEITKAAGYKTVRLGAGKRPDRVTVRQQILACLSEPAVAAHAVQLS